MTPPVTRDLTVAVFVTRRASDAEPRILLHEHVRLGRWLPPGGHIEPHELPDDAALREVLEETGLTVELVGDQIAVPSLPGEARQLVRPAGVQVVVITPGHEHVDLVYLARAAPDAEPTAGRWLTRAELGDPSLSLTAEVRAWCEHALGRQAGEDQGHGNHRVAPIRSPTFDAPPVR